MASNVTSTKKAAKVVEIKRKSIMKSDAPTKAQVDEYFDDLRQQYLDGKLSPRQIAAIEERLPGFLTKEGMKTSRKSSIKIPGPRVLKLDGGSTDPLRRR